MEQMALFVVVAVLAILVILVLLFGRDNPSKDIYESIPELRKIATLYQNSGLGTEAQIFLYHWQEIQRNIRKMRGERREKFLANLYYTRVQPMLEAHKRFQQQTRRNKK